MATGAEHRETDRERKTECVCVRVCVRVRVWVDVSLHAVHEGIRLFITSPLIRPSPSLSWEGVRVFHSKIFPEDDNVIMQRHIHAHTRR